ncbi:MAG: hypothetical protein LBK45_04350 [Tannerellaceae bacterium]|jgi:hypothetical protein|nr:hypothetical protein [Tannerellaceae bacterium]
MKLFYYILLCALPLVFSCQNEMGEPDKTVKNVTGTLHHFNEAEIWGIYYYEPLEPGVVLNDGGDLFLIKETNKDFHFEEGKKVTVSGSCYLAEEDPFPVTVGTTVYYIITTKLAYE